MVLVNLETKDALHAILLHSGTASHPSGAPYDSICLRRVIGNNFC